MCVTKNVSGLVRVSGPICESSVTVRVTVGWRGDGG